MPSTSPMNRRTFLTASGALAVGLAFDSASVGAEPATTTSMNTSMPKLTHHVFFWLKNPHSTEDLEKLLAGIRTLAAIKTVRGAHVGVPASTEKRPVVENSYSASELLLFDTVEDQNAYQVDPIHQKFVQDCSHLWSKVVVFDSIAV